MQIFGAELTVGKVLIVSGLGITGLGILVVILQKLGIHLGSLPGDIRVEHKNGGFYFPVVTCIVLSVVASVVLNWFGRR